MDSVWLNEEQDLEVGENVKGGRKDLNAVFVMEIWLKYLTSVWGDFEIEVAAWEKFVVFGGSDRVIHYLTG